MTSILPTRLEGGPFAVATHGLVKRFGRVTALDSVELQVPEGAMYVLVGPNGAGKSTTFKVLLDLLRPTAGSVEVGSTFQLTASPRDASGNEMGGGPAPTYTSSDPAKATVGADGVVRGLAPGTVTITATLAWGGATKTATAQLAVLPVTPPAAVFTTLALSPDAGTVAAGGTLQLQAQARDQNGAAIAGLGAATFASGNPAAATVSASGVVTGVAAGTATITASLTAGGVTRTASATVTVTETAAPFAVTVTARRSGFAPNPATIATGGTVTWVMDDDDHDVTWTGAAPAGGNVPRTEEGTSASRVFAAAGTYAYRCTRHDERGSVVVKGGGQTGPAVFTSLAVSPSSGGVQVGATLQLTATPRDQNGAAMAGLGTPAFTSSDPTRATVSAGGVVTGVAAGTATITATLTAGGTTRTGTASVTVTTTAPPTTGATVTTVDNTFSPPTVTIAPGGSVTWRISGSTHNVTFSTAAPTGGNVPDTSSGGSATRTFPTAGTYAYRCTRHNGMNGTVVVQ